MKVLYNARIHTLHTSRPTATAIALEHGRIVATGNDELLNEYDRAEKQNMNGRVILPGLTDAHLHLKYYALSLQKIECETATLAECLRRVGERVKKAQPGEWILGHGWNQNVWGNWPSAADLDRVAPDNPVYLTAKSLHAAWSNTTALKLAEITSSTPDPKDGQIQRVPGRGPTRIVLLNAMRLER